MLHTAKELYSILQFILRNANKKGKLNFPDISLTWLQSKISSVDSVRQLYLISGISLRTAITKTWKKSTVYRKIKSALI